LPHSGQYLYVHDWNALTISIVDLSSGQRAIAAIQLDYQASSMVISPADRVIYAAHPYNNFISVIDTGLMAGVGTKGAGGE
jgi:DNA-binding beta-propeller fold protein YncE